MSRPQEVSSNVISYRTDTDIFDKDKGLACLQIMENVNGP